MQYTVYFNGNHDVKDVEQKCSHGGYTFNGWECSKSRTPNSVYGTYRCSASESSTNTTCQDSNVIRWDFDDNMNCKALWEANEYNVTYDCNGGHIKGAADSVTTEGHLVETGQLFGFERQENKCEFIGHTPGKWNCENLTTHEHFSLDETSDYKKSPWNRDYDVKCVAQWDANDYVIRYHGGKAGERNVSINIPDQPVKHGEQNVNLHRKLQDITGYKFKSWSVCGNVEKFCG